METPPHKTKLNYHFEFSVELISASPILKFPRTQKAKTEAFKSFFTTGCPQNQKIPSARSPKADASHQDFI